MCVPSSIVARIGGGENDTGRETRRACNASQEEMEDENALLNESFHFSIFFL